MVHKVHVCNAKNAFHPRQALHCLLSSCFPLKESHSWVRFRHPPSAIFRSIATFKVERKTHNRQDKDIVPGDLTATLEAHRASNRALKVRKFIVSDPPNAGVYRPPFHLFQTPGENHKALKQDPPAKRSRSNPASKGTRKEEATAKVESPLVMTQDVETQSTSKHAIRRGLKRGKPIDTKPVLDYDPVYVKPAICQTLPDEKLPWITADLLSIQNYSERLGAEIKAFHDYFVSDSEEQAAAAFVIEEVKEGLRQGQFRGTLEVFGSRRTGLGLATSDIDLRLMPLTISPDTQLHKAPRKDVRRQLGGSLVYLFDVFRSDSKEFMLVTFRHSRYPLISMQHRESGLDIQIVLSNDTRLQRDYIQRQLSEIPDLKPLYVLFKMTLDIRGLNNVFRGGLGSYPLFNMLVAPLRLKIPENELGISNFEKNLEVILDFWGNLSTQHTAVSVEPPMLLKKYTKETDVGYCHAQWKKNRANELAKSQYALTKTKEEEPYMLCLQDPVDPYNDLGRKAFGIKHILYTLIMLRAELKMAKQNPETKSHLAAWVGSVPDYLGARREKVRAYARSKISASQASNI